MVPLFRKSHLAVLKAVPSILCSTSVIYHANFKKMKTPLSLLLFFVIGCLHRFDATAQQAIRFENTKWKAVLQKAEKEHKMIFLDCYTSWCGPCKWMEKNVYTNDTAAAFYNANFICAKVDMEANEGFDLAKRYQVTTYPTMLYLDVSGEVLHRTCGAVPTNLFVEDGKNALNPETQLARYSKRFRESPADTKNSFHYFEQLERTCLVDKAILESYFATQEDSALMSFYNWQLIFNYSEYGSRPFRYLEEKRTAFSKRYTKDSIDLKINNVYSHELRRALENRDNKKVLFLKDRLRKLNTKNGNSVIEHAVRKLEALPNSDIQHATVITDSIIGPVNVSKWSPKVGTSSKPYYNAWFKLDIKHDTLLSFDIVPVDSLDDYDFTVFKCESKDCVKNIKANTLKHIRLCQSYCISKSGTTGLSPYTTQEVVGAGHGPAYAASIPVKAGETYYIEVNYSHLYIAKGLIPIGFHIYFYNYWPRKKPIVLNHVLFDHNKAVLTKESFHELDKLALQMRKNQMKIEVQGHADNSGNEAQNQTLSEERAKAVVDYLISKNVHKNRLFYKGYGSTKPVASNESDEGRRQNRRVEFVMVMN